MCGLRLDRCVRDECGWCSIESVTGERVLEPTGTEEDGTIELCPVDYPTLLPVQKCALLSLRRLLREGVAKDVPTSVDGLLKLIDAGTSVVQASPVVPDLRFRRQSKLFAYSRTSCTDRGD